LKTTAFLHWRRQAYREAFHDVARRNIVYPVEVNNVRRCLASWRRYAKCNATRHAKEQHLQRVRDSLAARRCLREWFEAATHDGGAGLRARMLANKLSRVITRGLLTKALDRIHQFGVREDYLAERLAILVQTRRQSELVGYFGQWRQRFAQRELHREAVEQHRRRLLSDCFTVLLSHAKYSHSRHATMMQTQTALESVLSMPTKLLMQ
jgi:hypothetical protein